MEYNFKTSYSAGALAYITEHTFDDGELLGINTVARLLGVSALGIAGSIARELTGNDKVYPTSVVVGAALRDLYVATLSHEQLADDYIPSLDPNLDRSNGPGGILNKLNYPDINDIGPGRIRISTAIHALIRYQGMFPDTDPLNLSKYFQHYDLLVRDLLDVHSDAPIKIAGLVVQEAETYFKAEGSGTDGEQRYERVIFDPSGSAFAQWNQYSEGERASLDVKAYSTGFKSIEENSVGYWQYNLTGNGSDIYFFEKNQADLYKAMQRNGPRSLDLSLQPHGAGDANLSLKIDYVDMPSAPPKASFQLNSYTTSGRPIAYVTNKDIGEVRLDTVNQLTLSSGDDTLSPASAFDWASLGRELINVFPGVA